MSSGTSGHRGIFLVSEAEEVKWTAMLLANVLPRSLLSPTKIALFLRANSNLFESLKRGNIEFRFFDLLKPADELAKAVDAYAPDVLIATGSMLKVLAGFQDRGAIALDPARIYATAEVLDPMDQTAIEAAFGRMVHQIYHCTEGFLGISCEHGTIHLNETWVHVEREYLDAERTKFVPLVTDLERRTQPIIRYRLNDVLTLEHDGCPCGSPRTALRYIEGREDDIFYLPRRDGTLAPVFADAIRAVVMAQRQEIAEYKVVQRTPQRLEVALESKGPTADLHRRLASDFTTYFDMLGLVAPAVAFVPYVAPPRLAKLKRVERAFHPDKVGSP
jgi:putative adenylate-forming enzyme